MMCDMKRVWAATRLVLRDLRAQPTERAARPAPQPVLPLVNDSLQEQEPTLALISDQLESRYQRQMDTGARIEGKAAILLALVGAGAPFTASQPSSNILAIFAYVAYALAAAMALFVLNLRPHRDAPDPGFLVQHFRRFQRVDVLGALVAERLASCEFNEPINRQKAAGYRVTLVFSVMAVILTTAAIGVGHHGGQRTSSDTRCTGPARTSSRCSPAGFRLGEHGEPRH
jgi:hypothetical protein